MQPNILNPESLVNAMFIFLLSIFLLSLLAAVGAGAVIGYGIWQRTKIRHKKSLDSTLLEVSLPRDNEVKIDAAEQLFSSFTSLKGEHGILSFTKVADSITFEIVAKPGDIRFYIGVPRKLQDMVEKQINGAYPDAHIKEVEDYNIFETDGKVAFESLILKKADYLPIKAYKDFAIDPLSTLISTLGKMQEGEAVAIQILITAPPEKWNKAGRTHISDQKKQESNPETAKYSVDSKELEGIEQKISKPGFTTFIRLIATSSSKEAAEAHLSNIEGAFTQFSSFNSLTKDKPKFFKSMLMVDFIYRHIPLFRKGTVMNIEELATLFHFPNKSVESPHINWLAARTAPAPGNIPTEGLYIGKSLYRGHEKPVFLGNDDRRRHMYIIGKTGVGKSEFLKDMILQDIRNGEGVAVIDPHGDLIDDILMQIPPQRAEDVILFDPSDVERPMGLNMLEANTEDEKHFVTSSIINLMYKMYDPQKTGIIGPRFEHSVRNAMLTVMSEKGTTFVEVVRALTDMSYVQELLPKVDDPIVRRYWTDQIAQTSDFHKSEVLDYIVSKFGRFVTNKMIRNIIGQSESSFSFRQVMDEQKILLISLNKGRIGEENSSFLGLILVPKILVAAMSRQDIPQEQRKDFFLYVDEFQNFATPDFAQILSEARKYRLNLTVANQFIGQIEEDVKNAIFGNVGTIVSFRVGVNDGNYMQHEFQPTFSEADLINVEKYHAYVRTLIGGEPSTPFSLDLTRDIEAERAKSNPRVSELVKELSRLKYGRARDLVEQEINKRSNLFDMPEEPEALPGMPGKEGGFGGNV